jgi:hypothetical protein
MGQFRIFLIGNMESSVLELPASTLRQVATIACQGRFLEGTLIDLVDADGLCTNRNALIPVSRIQMIMDDQP